ncbi:hypothetical protein [Streptomyces sp. enrichment culture]|uniref:hypothetical protein n=1 Tax=Streptomyces sp. enrichment culture TaxID=1795815 RepID=UPI003F56376D
MEYGSTGGTVASGSERRRGGGPESHEHRKDRRLAGDAGLTAPRRYEVDGRAGAAVGTRLSADCNEYVHWFGPGAFAEFLITCVPGAA